MTEDDPLEQLKALKAAPPSDPLEELKATKKKAPLPGVSGHPIVDASPDEEPGIGTKILGTIASLDRDIPGAEAVQSGVRALVRREPYSVARNEIRGGEDAAPMLARVPARLIGGTIAAMATPGSGMLQGARYGVLNALASSDPEANAKNRLDNAALEGTLGALGAKAGEAGGAFLRSRFAPSLGASALARKGAIAAADDAAYGAAAREGTAAAKLPTPQAVTDALNSADIAPYAKAVRSSRTFANADDATVLREAYKLMSERQQLLAGRLSGKDFKAGTALEQSDINLAKRDLLTAGGEIMPSFPEAVQQHASMMGDRDAFRVAADATRRIARGVQPAAKNLETNSPESFAAMIAKMKAGEANAATQGLLGALKSQATLRGNPLKLFGIGSAAAKSARVAPYLTALDAQAGNPTSDILRSLGITAATPTSR